MNIQRQWSLTRYLEIPRIRDIPKFPYPHQMYQMYQLKIRHLV
jgi:hypothetical protein